MPRQLDRLMDRIRREVAEAVEPDKSLETAKGKTTELEERIAAVMTPEEANRAQKVFRARSRNHA